MILMVSYEAHYMERKCRKSEAHWWITSTTVTLSSWLVSSLMIKCYVYTVEIIKLYLSLSLSIYIYIYIYIYIHKHRLVNCSHGIVFISCVDILNDIQLSETQTVCIRHSKIIITQDCGVLSLRVCVCVSDITLVSTWKVTPQFSPLMNHHEPTMCTKVAVKHQSLLVNYQ